MGFFTWLTKSTLRVTAVAAAVKISVDNGVWSLNTNKSESVYEKFKKNILPGAIVYKQKVPPSDEIKIGIGSTWNDGVDCAFNFLNDAPENVKRNLNSFYKSESTTTVKT